MLTRILFGGLFLFRYSEIFNNHDLLIVYKHFSHYNNIDLQFSTDDEEFEEVVGDFDTAAAVLGQGEGLARSAQPVNYMPGKFFFRTK